MWSTLLYYFITVITIIEKNSWSVSGVAQDSYCINYRGDWKYVNRYTVEGYANVTRTHGTGNCTNGDIVLKGKYIQLGIHNFGSYGTRALVKEGGGYYNDRLGFIADYNRTGWANGFSGDFFIPGDPAEGWMLQWTPEGGSQRSHILMG
jgi:hypothetical protein